MVKREFGFVLVPGYSLLALSCAIDVLRAANQDAGYTVYNWKLLSADDALVMSSSGLPLLCQPLSQWHNEVVVAVKQRVIAICGGDTSLDYHNYQLTQWLSSASEQSMMMGSISDGAFIAAECGLFDNCRSTIHWKCLDNYREKFPQLDSRASILEIEGNRFSCAGGTASLDLFLHFVLKDIGSDAVSNIGYNYFHDNFRDSSDTQVWAHANRYANKNKMLNEALRLIALQLEEPLNIQDIAKQVGTTHRTLDRLFKRYIGLSPSSYIRQLRLSRAESLLVQTGMAVSDVGLACGFNSASLFGRHFKAHYKLTPLQFRQQALALS